MKIKSHQTFNALYRNRIKIMLRYIKRFFALFDFNLGYDEKLNFKILLPGVESGWNSNGSFKYTNRCEETNS